MPLRRATAVFSAACLWALAPACSKGHGEESAEKSENGGEGTRDFVPAAYTFEVLPGVGHFAADQVPDRVSELLLQHLARHPV